MWHVFLLAFGLVFVVEGLTPFLFPRLWRQAMKHMLLQSDRILRTFGFVSMLIGLGIMYLAH